MSCRLLWLEDGPLEAVAAAAAALSHGSVVVFPTDTVYGLLGACDSTAAYQGIYSLKLRQAGKPLALLVAAGSELAEQATAALQAHTELLQEFHRGRVTVVLPPEVLPSLPPMVPVLQPGFVGLRCPAHAFLQQLLSASGGLLWATSFNTAETPAIADSAAAQTWLTLNSGPELAVLSRTALPGTPSRVVRLEHGLITGLR
jgi:L-threonylcarbamoyladenylate synthase